MIYELRRYTAFPGRREELVDRFERCVLAVFDRCGIKVVGFWEVRDNDEQLIYLTRFTGEDARVAAWDRFAKDPIWIAEKRRSEANGPLVREKSSVILKASRCWTAQTSE